MPHRPGGPLNFQKTSSVHQVHGGHLIFEVVNGPDLRLVETRKFVKEKRAFDQGQDIPNHLGEWPGSSGSQRTVGAWAVSEMGRGTFSVVPYNRQENDAGCTESKWGTGSPFGCFNQNPLSSRPKQYPRNRQKRSNRKVRIRRNHQIKLRRLSDRIAPGAGGHLKI